MTHPVDPQPGIGPGPVVPTTPVPGAAVRSPLATLVVEKRRASAMNILLAVALVVAVGGVTFAAGRLTAPASAPAAAGTGRGGAGNGLPQPSGGPGGFAGGGLGGATSLVVEGTVQTIGADSITVVTPAGTTIEIPLQASTAYHGQTTAVATDVKAGQEVRIDVAAAGGGGFRPGAPGASASPGAVGGSGAPIGGGRAFGPALAVTIVTP